VSTNDFVISIIIISMSQEDGGHVKALPKKRWLNWVIAVVGGISVFRSPSEPCTSLSV
jgi:hypothetical protein